MVTIIYQNRNDEKWQRYCCPLGGRQEFDLTEAIYKCRWLVNKGAQQAVALQGAEVMAHWQWSTHQQGAVCIAGPEI